MQQLYTYETELKPKYNQDIIDYFNDYTILFNKIVRSVWQYYNHQDVLINQKAKLNTFIQNQFDVSKRTTNLLSNYAKSMPTKPTKEINIFMDKFIFLMVIKSFKKF